MICQTLNQVMLAVKWHLSATVDEPEGLRAQSSVTSLEKPHKYAVSLLFAVDSGALTVAGVLGFFGNWLAVL
jgi:hypothetical protein